MNRVCLYGGRKIGIHTPSLKELGWFDGVWGELSWVREVNGLDLEAWGRDRKRRRDEDIVDLESILNRIT